MSALINPLYYLNNIVDSRPMRASGQLKCHVIALAISLLLLYLPDQAWANKTKPFQCTAHSVQLLTQPPVAQNTRKPDSPEFRNAQKAETPQLSYQ
ncbi:MAG: hypothetical protein GQ532_01885, partial [Methylomarinum sp.]|nr:hypothetical protein [Methylomarinum sp.]